MADTEIQAGLVAFDPNQGQSCLDALTVAASACTVANQNDVLAACVPQILLLPTVPVGGTCLADDECLPPTFADGGLVFPMGLGSSAGLVAAQDVSTTTLYPPTHLSLGNPLFGCDVTTAVDQLTCGGTCSYGHNLGEPCSPARASGAGCAQGYCSPGRYTDGGNGDVCTAYDPIGSPCLRQCDPSGSCYGIEDGGYLCQLQGGANTICDTPNCLTGNCTCSTGFYCTDSTDGGPLGSCAAVSDGGGACVTSACQNSAINCACNTAAAYCAPNDGGTDGTCAPLAVAGDPCTASLCPFSNYLGCECSGDMVCMTPADGGVQTYCTPKESAGGACVWNDCNFVGAQLCQCDTTNQSLYCPTSTQVCTPRAGLLQACSTGDFFPCADGLACTGSGQCYSATPSNVGDPCSPFYGSSCQGDLICSAGPAGTCQVAATLGQACDPVASPSDCGGSGCLAVEDGGSVCLPNVGLGGDCTSQPCREFLDCVYVSFTDAGSGRICEAESTVDAGAPCDPADPSACVVGYCDAVSTTCVPYLNLGDTCSGLPTSACGPQAGCPPQTGFCTPSCDIVTGTTGGGAGLGSGPSPTR